MSYVYGLKCERRCLFSYIWIEFLIFCLVECFVMGR